MRSRQWCPHVLICGQDIKCPKKGQTNVWNCGGQPSGWHCGRQSRRAAVGSCVLSQLQRWLQNHRDLWHCFPVHAKATGLRAGVPQTFSYISDINTHPSTDSKIYMQQISPTSGFHVCLHVSIGTIKHKVAFFFFHSPLEYPFSFRKILNNLISSRV